MKADTGVLLVNFGGPRSLSEVEPFLCALLTDRDVIRTPFPQWIHNVLFRRVAKKRALKVSEDYEKIGGGSPIWADTEFLADALRERGDVPVLTFHRYLPETHFDSLKEIANFKGQLLVFPMFPQFTYATTGSIARFFQKTLTAEVTQKMRWVKSYPAHPAFIRATCSLIREFLAQNNLREEEVFFLFSAHGVPNNFVEEGDPYVYECNLSYRSVMEAFPDAPSLLSYQSQFGRAEWVRPYTAEVCKEISGYAKGRQHCLFVPISFTSDHIETLFEVEDLYMPLIKEAGLIPLRIPALNRRHEWIAAISQILSESSPCTTSMLIRT